MVWHYRRTYGRTYGRPDGHGVWQYTRFFFAKSAGKITPKVRKSDLLFLYVTRHLVLFYISTVIKIFQRVFKLQSALEVLRRCWYWRRCRHWRRRRRWRWRRLQRDPSKEQSVLPNFGRGGGGGGGGHKRKNKKQKKKKTKKNVKTPMHKQRRAATEEPSWNGE